MAKTFEERAADAAYLVGFLDNGDEPIEAWTLHDLLWLAGPIFHHVQIGDLQLEATRRNKRRDQDPRRKSGAR